jgi:hypothetical protein
MEIDPIQLKSIRTIGNRSEQMEIDPNKWKSVRTIGNRSEQMEIDPNKWKSIQTNGNRTEQIEISPNLIRAALQYPTNQHRLVDDAFSHQCCMAIIGGTEREIDEDGLYLSAIHYLLSTTSVYLSTSSLCKSSSNSCANPRLPLV